MSQAPVVNLNSLALVREELDASIQRSAGEFEAYLLDHNNRAALESCRADMAQVAGTLRLIQFSGAALLADEMVAAIAAICTPTEGAAAEALAGTLSHAFFILPRYIEFVAGKRPADPALMITFVNELRVARRQSLIPEYHFFDGELPLRPRQALASVPALGGTAALPRLWQMYQVGLLAILRQKSEALNLQLLARASARFAAQVPPDAAGGLWYLAAAVTQALAGGGLKLSLNRRRTLGTLERLMGRFIKGGEAALAGADDSVRRELVYLLAISPQRDGLIGEVITAFGIPALTPDDAELTRAREAMRGPGLEAIESVVKVLKEELRNAKDVLEIASQSQSISAEEVAPLRDMLNRVADTLRLLNLRAASNILREQLTLVEGWVGQKNGVAPEQFLSVADALLFIESSLAALYRNDLGGGELEQVSDAVRKQIIADSQLSEASAIVIGESHAGIALAKRAITAYVESGFDAVHVANVATTLGSVRGALQILGHTRAAAVLAGCVAFIDDHLKDKQQTATQRQQVLETLADALISLEYYLTELAAERAPDGKILDVAEESLAAIGYNVR